jgi:hypothetical protein
VMTKPTSVSSGGLLRKTDQKSSSFSNNYYEGGLSGEGLSQASQDMCGLWPCPLTGTLGTTTRAEGGQVPAAHSTKERNWDGGWVVISTKLGISA